MCVCAPPISACSCPDLFLKNQHPEAAAVDPARVSRRARPAADLRRIRHVDRGRVPQGRARRSARSRSPLAEELTLTTAELSYLQDRRQAYDNLAKRTDLEASSRSASRLRRPSATARRSAQTLRVMAQENRDMRMSEAEKKAAAPAAQAHRADDPVLPAGAVHRHSRPGRHPRDGAAVVRLTARGRDALAMTAAGGLGRVLAADLASRRFCSASIWRR